MNRLHVPMRKRVLAGAVVGAALTLNPWTVSSDLRPVANAAFAVSDTGVSHAAPEAAYGIGVAQSHGPGTANGSGGGSGPGGGGSGGGCGGGW